MIALAAQDQLALVALGQRHHEDTRPHEDFAAQVIGQQLVRCCLGGEGGDLGLGNAPLQPLDAEIGNRRQEDQHFAQHDEDDGQSQYLARQPPEEARFAYTSRWFLVGHRLNMLTAFITRRTQTLDARP